MATPDGLYVSFPDYDVAVGNIKGHQVSMPLGHAIAVAVDPLTGSTRGSEFGRYDKGDLGLALRVFVPNYKGNLDNKEDMVKYARKLYERYAKIHGVNKIGKRIKITYIPDTDYNTMVKDMENSERNGLKRNYNWLGGITCGSYAHNIAVGDDPSDREFGTPELTAPATLLYPRRYVVTYENKD